MPQALACSLIFSIFIKQKSDITYGEVHTQPYVFQGEVQTFSELVKNLYPVLRAIRHGTDTQSYSQLECALSCFASPSKVTLKRGKNEHRESLRCSLRWKRQKAKLMKERNEEKKRGNC